LIDFLSLFAWFIEKEREKGRTNQHGEREEEEGRRGDIIQPQPQPQE